MNIHKNARLTVTRRMELVQDILEGRLRPCAAAATYGVSLPTANKWVGRYLAEGKKGLLDRSSRPRSSPRTISATDALAIVELRRRRLTQARIASSVGVSKSTVGRVLARAGLSRLRDLEPTEPVLRYEHALPGDLIHIDTKKLGRIERTSIALRAIGATRRVPRAGSFCSSRSTITLALGSPICIRTNARTAPFNSSATPWPISDPWACGSNECSLITVRLSAPKRCQYLPGSAAQAQLYPALPAPD